MKRFSYIFLCVLLILIILIYWSTSSTSNTFQRCEILNIETLDDINFKNHDSVLVAASTLYEADNIKTIIQGSQYREAWSTPVMVPIVFLDTLLGGMTIEKKGGGQQTQSLRLKAKNGIEYTLRSVNKNPEPLIPGVAKTLGLENIIIDGISAQHPYAALVVAKLSDNANMIHTNPKLYFVPKQDFLKNYNDDFGNRLYYLEYETEGDVNWTNINDVHQIVDTKDLQELKLNLKDSLSIDKRCLIKMRLFDFMIGDWDRHTKQWGWAVQKSKHQYLGIPIAGDRDNAFFKPEGLIPSIIANEHVIPELRPFDNHIDFMEGLVYPFDRYFLLNTSEELFITEAENLKRLLSDSIIDNSLKVWPKEILNLYGKEIADKIKHRRNDLLEYAKQFKLEIDSQGAVKEALKGSEDLSLTENLIHCFECD